jgi:hypothetical protein
LGKKISSKFKFKFKFKLDSKFFFYFQKYFTAIKTPTMSGPITCHVLDSSRGMPGKNIQVKLEVRESNETETWRVIGQT